MHLPGLDANRHATNQRVFGYLLAFANAAKKRILGYLLVSARAASERVLGHMRASRLSSLERALGYACAALTLTLAVAMTQVFVPTALAAEKTEKSGSGTTATPSAADRDLDDDPDLPAFLSGKVDKDEYLRKREEHINRLRGIEPGRPFDPTARGRAIRELNRQEGRPQGTTSTIGSGTAGGFDADDVTGGHNGGSSQVSPFISTTTWTSIGPAPLPNGQTYSVVQAVSGRVSAIAIHPTNSNIVYVGAAQGGVYRTLDGGATWTALLDNADSLAVGAIAIAPSQPSTIYVGTGEANFGCDTYFGVGVYRIDNADSASPTVTGPLNKDGSNNDVFSGWAIGKIVVHPTNPDIIFVGSTTASAGITDSCLLPNDTSATSTKPRGLFRSTNATSASPTFTRLTMSGVLNGGNRSVCDIEFEPGNPNTLLAAVVGGGSAGLDGGVYRSTDALAATPTFTRTLAAGSSSATARVELAINKVGAAVTVFAATSDSNGTLKRSTDGGVTWSAALSSATGFCSGQCFYDMPIALDPNNANILYLGGAADGTLPAAILIKSTNALSTPTFAKIQNGLHADSHAIEIYAASTSTVWFGSDGGVWRSTDSGSNWTSRSTTGFNATQFQSLALHPTDQFFMIGGTQDNGTEWQKPDNTWTRADFGDGGFALIDQNAANTTNVTMYHTYYNQTSTLIGYGWVTTTANAHDNGWTFNGTGGAVSCTNGGGFLCSETVNFYAPMALGPGSPGPIYFGTDRLHRSTGPGNTNSTVSQAPIVSGVPISAIGISPQSDNVRIVGLLNGKVYRTMTGSTTLNDVTGTIPAQYVARAVIDPNNQNTAYVTLSAVFHDSTPHIYKTTTLNNTTPTWMGIGSTLPDLPVNAFVVDPADSNKLYAGNDIGVYRSTDGGTTWTAFSNGLPRVAIFDMAIQNSNRILRVATHGRGIWEISLLTDTGTLQGTVTNASTSAAISGATVTAGSNTTTTNASGFYQFSGIASGSYTVTASQTGYASSSTSANVTTGNTTTQNFALTPNVLQGTVTNASTSAAISGATVTADSNTTTTNGSGFYQFSAIAAGSYTVTASAAGYSNGSASGVTVTAGGTTTQNFALTPTSGSCTTDTTQADFNAGTLTNVETSTNPGNVKLVIASTGTETLDQQNTTVGSTGQSITTTTWEAQTFIPGIAGSLTRLDVDLFCSGCSGTNPDITVEIRNTTGGAPGSTVLATTTIPGFSSGTGTFYTATFSTPATLTTATTYSYVLRLLTNRTTGTYAHLRSNNNQYANGAYYISTTSGSAWTANSQDFGFKTYMTPPTTYQTSGNLVSSLKDSNPLSGDRPRWTSLSWTATVPASTTVRFQAAGSNSSSGPFTFVGPGGSGSTYFTADPSCTAGSSTLSQFNGLRYLKYKALLDTTLNTTTPTLSDVTVGFATCNGQPNGTTCDDGNACTQTDTCQSGVCTGSNPVVCTALDQCHDVGTCNTGTGVCTNPNKTNGVSCNDGLFCNGTDTCSSGNCSGHSGDPCAGGTVCNNICNETADNCFSSSATTCTSDGNVCTDDHCDGAGTCAHTNNTGSCDDGLFCNGTDTCSGGTCGHSGDPCAGGAVCNDSCNEAADNCFNPSTTACTSDGNVCTDDHCNGTGTCAHTNNTGSCDDGLFCNGTDTCGGGTCQHSGDPCAGGAVCNNACNESADNCFNPSTTACTSDGNVCTDDHCDGAGTCAHTNNTAACDDGLFCNGTDTCSGGSCGHSGDPCAGGAVCANLCNEAADNCFNPNTTACTSDGNVCTDDYCDGSGTCAHTNNSDSCDDGNECTQTDTCSGGTCVGGNPVTCTASDPCHVVGTCDPQTGLCSDPPKDCSDSNDCTTDTCDLPSGTCNHSTASGACNIAGHVYYYRDHMTSAEPSSKPIAGENVQRASSTEATQTSTTDASGQYSFTSEAGDITLTPAQVRLVTSETECRDAIGASDAAAIARASVGLEVLSDNQKVAGDVSYNGTVSSFDAALVSQKAVATSCTGYHFPARNTTGSDWAFRPVVKNYTPIAGTVSFDFSGLLYGDVTGNWGASSFTPAAGPTEVETTSAAQEPVAGPLVTGTVGSVVETTVFQESYPKAVLYLVSGPSQNTDGGWEVVLGLARSDGILGMDLGLHYDASAIHVRGVTATGIGSDLSAVTNDSGSDLLIALYGTAALQGSGAFLKVTYEVMSPVNGMPFSVAAQANEGQVPIVWSPGVPGGGAPGPRVSVDR